MPEVLDKPYCSLADVQGVAGVDGTESDSDDNLIKGINLASRTVDELCGRSFWFNDFTVDAYLVPRRQVIGDLAFIPFEVIELTEVKLDDVEIDLAEIYAPAGVMSLQYSGNWGSYPFTSKLELFGTFGFMLRVDGDDEPVLTEPPLTLPASIRRATALIAAAFSNEWRKDRVSPDGTRESLLEVRIPAEAKDLLRQWDIRKRFSTF